MYDTNGVLSNFLWGPNRVVYMRRPRIAPRMLRAFSRSLRYECPARMTHYFNWVFTSLCIRSVCSGEYLGNSVANHGRTLVLFRRRSQRQPGEKSHEATHLLFLCCSSPGLKIEPSIHTLSPSGRGLVRGRKKCKPFYDHSLHHCVSLLEYTLSRNWALWIHPLMTNDNSNDQLLRRHTRPGPSTFWMVLNGEAIILFLVWYCVKSPFKKSRRIGSWMTFNVRSYALKNGKVPIFFILSRWFHCLFV